MYLGTKGLYLTKICSNIMTSIYLFFLYHINYIKTTLIARASDRCSDYRLMSPCRPFTSRLIVQIKFDVRGDDDTYLSSSPTAGYLDFSHGRHTPIPAPNPASNFVRSIEEWIPDLELRKQQGKQHITAKLSCYMEAQPDRGHPVEATERKASRGHWGNCSRSQ